MIEIISEISGAHGGHLSSALKLIEAAKEAGATGVKFQAFSPERLALRRVKHPRVKAIDWPGKPQTWDDDILTPALVDLYRQTWTPPDWFPQMIECATTVGLTWHASVFDPEDVEFLETLNCPRYKVASFEATEDELLTAVGHTDKDMIVSINQHDDIPFIISDNIVTLNDFMGHGKLTVLHATDYGATPTTAGLAKLRKYVVSNCTWGLSDHTTSPLAAQIAATLGASMIEKHIKLANVHTPDDAFAVVPSLFELMVARVRAIEEALNG